jgi:hypothetical protein
MIAATLMVRIAAETTAFHTEMQRAQRAVTGTAQQMEAASAAVTALQSRLTTLTQSYRIGRMTEVEYAAGLRTLKADMASLATTTEMTSKTQERLAAVGNQVNRGLRAVTMDARRGAQGFEAFGVASEAAALVTSRGIGGIAMAAARLQVFALGNPWLVGILSGLAAFAAAWQLLNGAIGDTNDEVEKLLAKNRTLLAVQLAVNRAALAQAQARTDVSITDPSRFRVGANVGALANAADVIRLTEDNTRLTAAINALDVAAGHEARTQHASAAAHEQAKEGIEAHRRALEMFDASLRNTATATAALQLRANAELTASLEAQAKALRLWREEANANVVAAMKLIAAEQEAAKAATGGSRGGAPGGDRTMPGGSGIGGAIGGSALQSLVGFSTVAGGLALVGNAIGGFVSDLFGSAARVREARRLQAEALKQFTDDLDAFRRAVAGTDTGLQAAIRQAHDDAARLRAEAAAVRAGVGPGFQGTNRAANAAAQAEYERRLVEIAFLEAIRVIHLREEAAILRQQRIEDLAVRMLRAQGHDAEADAMAFALQQQREYADAVLAGADAQERATLVEVQRAEAIRFAADKIKATIAGLTTTIDSLRDFQTSLRTGPLTTLSPIQQLAEARRQYEAVLAQAQTGDQTAAGRLPQVAQAFLAASRAVNASGGRYAVDFTRVLADTDAIAKIFEGQRSIQQQMLDALVAIQDNTSVFLKPPKDGGTPPGFPPPPPLDGKPPKTALDDPLVLESQQQSALLLAGFTQLTEEVVALRAEAQDNARKLALVLEGLKV